MAALMKVGSRVVTLITKVKDLHCVGRHHYCSESRRDDLFCSCVKIEGIVLVVFTVYSRQHFLRFTHSQTLMDLLFITLSNLLSLCVKAGGQGVHAVVRFCNFTPERRK